MLEAQVVRDKKKGLSRGFGFITFETKEQALTALEARNGKEFMSKVLNIEISVSEGPYQLQQEKQSAPNVQKGSQKTASFERLDSCTKIPSLESLSPSSTVSSTSNSSHVMDRKSISVMSTPTSMGAIDTYLSQTKNYNHMQYAPNGSQHLKFSKEHAKLWSPQQPSLSKYLAHTIPNSEPNYAQHSGDYAHSNYFQAQPVSSASAAYLPYPNQIYNSYREVQGSSAQTTQQQAQNMHQRVHCLFQEKEPLNVALKDHSLNPFPNNYQNDYLAQCNAQKQHQVLLQRYSPLHACYAENGSFQAKAYSPAYSVSCQIDISHSQYDMATNPHAVTSNPLSVYNDNMRNDFRMQFGSHGTTFDVANGRLPHMNNINSEPRCNSYVDSNERATDTLKFQISNVAIAQRRIVQLDVKENPALKPTRLDHQDLLLKNQTSLHSMHSMLLFANLQAPYTTAASRFSQLKQSNWTPGSDPVYTSACSFFTDEKNSKFY